MSVSDAASLSASAALLDDACWGVLPAFSNDAIEEADDMVADGLARGGGSDDMFAGLCGLNSGPGDADDAADVVAV